MCSSICRQILTRGKVLLSRQVNLYNETEQVVHHGKKVGLIEAFKAYLGEKIYCTSTPGARSPLGPATSSAPSVCLLWQSAAHAALYPGLHALFRHFEG